MDARSNINKNADNDPCYVISVAARMLGTHTHTLRYYERIGIIEPSRSAGNIRLYSEQDITRLRRVQNLKEDLGGNLAGVEVILNMAERIEMLQKRVEELEEEVGRLHKSP